MSSRLNWPFISFIGRLLLGGVEALGSITGSVVSY
jgi:hypothetical protein